MIDKGEKILQKELLHRKQKILEGTRFSKKGAEFKNKIPFSPSPWERRVLGMSLEIATWGACFSVS